MKHNAVERKACTNVACSMVGTTINTDKENCLGCGKELKRSSLEDLFDKLAGNRDKNVRAMFDEAVKTWNRDKK